MLFRAVVIEGVACSGKTSALHSLVRHPAFVERPGSSSLVLSEHHTQRVLEGLAARSELKTANSVDLLNEHVGYVRGLRARLLGVQRWSRDNAANPRFVVVFERFHLTHVLNYDDVVWRDVAGIDAELAEMGFDLCVLTARRMELEQRLAARGADWSAFLAEQGQRHRIDDAAHFGGKVGYFVEQQEELLALAERSRMPTTVLDTSTLSLDQVVSRLLDVLALAT